jgi:hypothetical protein
MKNVFQFKKQFMVAALFVSAASAVAGQTNDTKKGKDSAPNQFIAGDTSQPQQRNNDKDEFRMNDLDRVMKQLDIQLKDLNIKMKDINLQLSKELKETIQKIDLDKMNKEIANEIKKVDVEKIKVEVNNSLKEAQEQIKKIDMEKMKQQLAEVQNNLNNGEFKKQMEEAMNSAKKGIEGAKKELQQLKEFTGQLEKDGLIDKKQGYTIEWKNGGDLYINGKKQTKEISEKYKKYYKKDGYKIHVNPGEDALNIESL